MILAGYPPRPRPPSRGVNLRIYFLITYLICLSSVVLSTNCCIVASIVDCSGTYCHYNNRSWLSDRNRSLILLLLVVSVIVSSNSNSKNL